jgi:AraC-like DNA-binding protein
MLRPAELLPLWNALAAASTSLGPLQVWRRSRRAEPRQGFDPHPTPTLVLGLRGVTRVERPNGARVDLLAGHALVIAAWVPHQHARLRRDSACLCQGFDRGGSDLLLQTRERSWSHLFAAVPYRELLDRAIAAGVSEEERRRAVMAALRHLLEEDWLPPSPMPERLVRGINALRGRLQEPIGAGAIVAATGLAPATAYRHFARWVGTTPRRALEQRRLSLAADLLAGGAGCAEAARACGYASRFTFTRAFRRVHGASPATWRRRQRDAKGFSAPPAR